MSQPARDLRQDYEEWERDENWHPKARRKKPAEVRVSPQPGESQDEDTPESSDDYSDSDPVFRTPGAGKPKRPTQLRQKAPAARNQSAPTRMRWKRRAKQLFDLLSSAPTRTVMKTSIE